MIIVIIVSIMILYVPSALLSRDTNGGKMAFAAPVPFPLLEVERKLPLAISENQTTAPVIVQRITGAGMGQTCEECQFIVYKPGTTTGRPVIAYTSATPLDLTDAKRIVFFAKGELGGETIRALAIGKPPGMVVTPPLTAFRFEVVSPDIVLTTDWTRYELNVDGLDLTGVSVPFGLVILPQRGGPPVTPGPSAGDNPPKNNPNVNQVSFYLKGVSIDNTPAANPINIIGSQLTGANTFVFSLPSILGTGVIPTQSYTGGASGDDPNSKIKSTTHTDKKSASQHMGQDNFCYGGDDCQQANQGQQIAGKDNDAAGFNDQSLNVPQSPSTTTPTPPSPPTPAP